MTDDELLAIYGATRQMAEAMQARDAELRKSTVSLEAAIAQVRQLPAVLGAQTSEYISAGIREVAQDSLREPLSTAIEGPIQRFDAAAYRARAAVEQIRSLVRFQTWTAFGAVLALGMVLGSGATYFFFVRQVAALNDRFGQLQQILDTPVPAPAEVQASPQPRKKRGAH